jgi:hypothetical protein
VTSSVRYGVLAKPVGPKRPCDPIEKAAPKKKAKSGRLPYASVKRISEKAAREAVRAEVLERDRYQCIPALRGLPGACASPFAHRPTLEVHEFRQRSTHPGSHLRPADCVTTCQRHHDYCTSPVGEMRALVLELGLIELATT